MRQNPYLYAGVRKLEIFFKNFSVHVLIAISLYSATFL